jgi:catechol 2,3-dioxygenase-like lactoylglutathione lyase family enzyme
MAMDHHFYGRLIDHLQLRVADIEASRRFYAAILEALGRRFGGEGEDYFWSDELYVSAVDAKSQVSHVHLSFQAADQEAVKRFHAAGVAAGGRDNGGPGFREYHAGYFGAFLLDPDSNNIEATWHGPGSRNLPAVEVDRDWG